MVRVLAVADEVSDALWGPRAAALHPDLVLAAGDLPWDYLEFLSSALDRPVVFVPGNHDPAVVDARQHRSGQFLRAGMPCDRPHEGVEALHGVLERLAPRWHLHGHVHPYGQPRPDRAVGPTTLRNVIPYRLFEIAPAAAVPAGATPVLGGTDGRSAS